MSKTTATESGPVSRPDWQMLTADPRLTTRTLSTPVELPARSLDEWQHRREVVLRTIRYWVGPDLRPREQEPAAVVTGEHAYSRFSVRNVAVPLVAGLFATGNLYIPNGSGPFPAVLHPHGHWPNGRFEDSSTVSVPARCINLALRGYVSFTYDMLGYGDSVLIDHQYGSDEAAACQWGISLFGLQIQAGLASLDYLLRQPFVDNTRIACTGASGGGSQTMILAALDDRITAVAPVNMLSATCQGWCLCENPPGLRVDTNNLEIAALIAPRPLLLISATGDWTTRTPTVEFPQIRRVYELYGAPERVANVHVDAAHNYNMESRQALYRWLDGWFMSVGHNERYLEIPYPTPIRSTLEVDTSRLPVATSEQITAKAIAAAKQEAGELVAAPPNEQVDRLTQLLGVTPEPVHEVHRTTSVLGRFTCQRLILRRQDSGEIVPCWLVGDDGGGFVGVAATADSPHTWARTWESVIATVVDAGGRLLLVEPFLGGGWCTPNGRLGRDHSMPFFTTYNRPDAAEWVRDIVSATRFGATLGDVAFLIGTGSATGPALLAAAICSSLPGVALDGTALEGWQSEGLIAPGLERSGGLRAAAGLTAHRRVLILGERRPELFAALGEASDQLRICPSNQASAAISEVFVLDRPATR